MLVQKQPIPSGIKFPGEAVNNGQNALFKLAGDRAGPVNAARGGEIDARAMGRAAAAEGTPPAFGFFGH